MRTPLACCLLSCVLAVDFFLFLFFSALPSPFFRFRFGHRLFHPVFFLWVLVCCLLGFGFCCDSFIIWYNIILSMYFDTNVGWSHLLYFVWDIRLVSVIVCIIFCFLLVFPPEVIFRSRVLGACPVSHGLRTTLQRWVNVTTTTKTSTRFLGLSWVLMTMGHNIHNNQNRIWWVTTRECLVFGSIVGPDYYGYGTRNSIPVKERQKNPLNPIDHWPRSVTKRPWLYKKTMLIGWFLGYDGCEACALSQKDNGSTKSATSVVCPYRWTPSAQHTPLAAARLQQNIWVEWRE